MEGRGVCSVYREMLTPVAARIQSNRNERGQGMPLWVLGLYRANVSVEGCGCRRGMDEFSGPVEHEWASVSRSHLKPREQRVLFSQSRPSSQQTSPRSLPIAF